MSTIKRFEDIDAWKKANELNAKIYSVSGKNKFLKDYGLRDQIRRASVSVMSNIAEGFEREGKKEFIQFLSIAKGSMGEVRSLLHVALREQYIEQIEFDEYYNNAEELSRMIFGFMKYLKKTEIKGNKYSS